MKTKVVIVGDENQEHQVFVENNDKYYAFYFDGYEGVSGEYIISFLKFLGHEAFVMYKDKFDEYLKIVNWRDYI